MIPISHVLWLIFLFFFWAYATACFSYLFEFSIDKPGRIFFKYKLWLARRAFYRNDRANYVLAMAAIAKTCMIDDLTQRQMEKRRLQGLLIEQAGFFTFWEKTMGLCSVCFNVPIAMGTYFLTMIQFHFVQYPWLMFTFIAYVCISSRFLRAMNKS